VQLLRLPDVPPKGDVSDYLVSHTKDDLIALLGASPMWRPEAQPIAPDGAASRSVTLTPASTIKPRPVCWLWDGRLALGTLALLGRREGIGKTICAYTLAADHPREWGTPAFRLPLIHTGIWCAGGNRAAVDRLDDVTQPDATPRATG
jgi:hypothetical protein